MAMKTTVASSLMKSILAQIPMDTKNKEEDTKNPSAIPDDAVRPGSRYDEQGFFFSVNKRTYLTIRVTRADSPDRFYFQLFENLERMEACWNSMDVFYESENGDMYKMVEDDVLHGLPIAVRFWDKEAKSFRWRRAEIMDYMLEQNCTVQVMDVDFGYVNAVKLDDIRLLRAEYFVLHKQAIDAALAYVYPSKGDQWTPEALTVLHSFLHKYPLVAEVVGTINDSLALAVCDTSDPEIDVYLADALIKSGHAVPLNMVKPFTFYRGSDSQKPAIEKAVPHSR